MLPHRDSPDVAQTSNFVSNSPFAVLASNTLDRQRTDPWPAIGNSVEVIEPDLQIMVSNLMAQIMFC